MNKMIIGIVGEIASGKTTVTDYLKQKYKAVSFRFSDILRDILKRLHLPEDRQNMQQLSSALRTHFSEDILSKVLTEDVKMAQAPVIITEGIRRPSDIEFLKNLEGFVLIALKTDAQTRFERLTKRSENPDDQEKTWEQFQKDNNAEAEQKIKDIAAMAKYTVENNGDLKDLYKQIDEIVGEIEKNN